MSDVNLFRIQAGEATDLEKPLQILTEQNPPAVCAGATSQMPKAWFFVKLLPHRAIQSPSSACETCLPRFRVATRRVVALAGAERAVATAATALKGRIRVKLSCIGSKAG